jgi:predicted XRE-type DNA-binding protein
MKFIIAIKQAYVMVDLKRLMFDMSLSQRDLAQIIGTAQSEISHFANGRRDLKGQYLQSLIAHFGQETIDAYTRPDKPFEGIPTEATVTILTPEVVEEIKEEVKEEVLKTTIVLPAEVIRDPDINIKAELKAGNLQEYKQPTQDIIPDDLIKVYTYCDDMEPEIRAGEPVLVRLLPSGIPIVPGDMYFVDLPSGGKIRYIEKEEDSKLYLKARNAAYGDIVIERSRVQSLFAVMMILRTPRSMSVKESTAQEMLINKDRHLDRLLDQFDRAGERERMLIEHLIKK